MKKPNVLEVSPNEVVSSDYVRHHNSVAFYAAEYLESASNTESRSPFQKHVVTVYTKTRQLVCLDGNHIVQLARALSIPKIQMFLMIDDDQELPWLFDHQIDGAQIYPRGIPAFVPTVIDEIRRDGDTDLFDPSHPSEELLEPIRHIALAIQDIATREEFIHRTISVRRPCFQVLAGKSESSEADATADAAPADLAFDMNNLRYDGLSDATREHVERVIAMSA